MKIIKLIENSNQSVIDQTINVLSSGGLIIFPTETTYGAGVDATNQSAVNKLLSYKGRREGKPLSIAVNSQQMAEKYVILNESAQKNYQRFLPGPVTIISQGKHVLAQGVESEFGSLGVRIPDYQLILDLLSKFAKPITATSANPSGGKRPYKIEDLLATLSQKQIDLIDLIIDAGELAHNPPSTVIDTTLSTPITVRQGEVENTKQQEITTLISKSESETMDIAGKLMLKHWDDIGSRGLIIALDGPLGAGKTIFAKGVAKFLQIKETITSPTYTYIEEYEFNRHQKTGQLFHLDVWKIDSKDLLDKLEISKTVGPNKVTVVEWWDNITELIDLTQFKNNDILPCIIKIDVNDKNSFRELKMSYLSK